MSTTVTYKGSTLTTVENETRTLTTRGKYLEDNLTLVDVTSGGEPSLQSKTYTVDSAGTETVTPDSGYDGLSSVSVNVPSASFWTGITDEFYGSGNTRMWKATAFTEIDSSKGDNAGYIPEGHWDGEEPLIYSAVPSGTTVTPTESAQTVGGTKHMMEGAVTVNAIPSEYIIPSGTSNITSNGIYDVANFASASVSVPVGVFPSGTSSITANGIYDITSFASVDVNVSGGGGGDAEDGIIARTISGTYENSRVTAVGTQAFRECKSLISASFNNAASIGSYAFEACTSLTTATFPSATFISAYAFGGCTRLATISFPIAKTIGNSAFNYCSSSLTTAIFPSATNIGATAFAYCYKLATISFPKVVSIQNSAFQYCSSLTTASFPNAKTIGNQAFRYCSKFESLYLLSASMATLGTNVFLSTPMSNSTYLGYFGSIYVPSSLVSSYQTATNWMAYSARITSYVE